MKEDGIYYTKTYTKTSSLQYTMWIIENNKLSEAGTICMSFHLTKNQIRKIKKYLGIKTKNTISDKKFNKRLKTLNWF